MLMRKCFNISPEYFIFVFWRSACFFQLFLLIRSGQNSVWTSGIVQLKKVYPKESLKLNKNVWEFYKRVFPKNFLKNTTLWYIKVKNLNIWPPPSQLIFLEKFPVLNWNSKISFWDIEIQNLCPTGG